MDFISTLERELGIEAKKEFLPIAEGDVIDTLSDNKEISDWIGTSPKTSLSDGIKVFVEWYKNYYC